MATAGEDAAPLPDDLANAAIEGDASDRAGEISDNETPVTAQATEDDSAAQPSILGIVGAALAAIAAAASLLGFFFRKRRARS